MDLRQLSALVGVAENGSFSAAAYALNTVQSNVSTHVARLERELGAVLVDRSSGSLTEEGHAVVARARRVNEELQGLTADVMGMRHEVVGTARVGMIGTTARWLAPGLLDWLRSKHPRLRLVLVEGNTTTLEPQIHSGRVDLALVNLPVQGADLISTPLFEEDLVLVVRKDHALAHSGSIELADLGGIKLLLPPQGTTYRDELDAAVRPVGVSLSPIAELDGMRLIASLVFEGYGPAILPA
ncbi:MAG: LysR family transcriptional regulator, partial [Acidimicrobiales bacterium]